MDDVTLICELQPHHSVHFYYTSATPCTSCAGALACVYACVEGVVLARFKQTNIK